MTLNVVSSDALRFLIAGALNTTLTSIIFFLCAVALPLQFAYAVAWISGILIVALFYPDYVFIGGRRSPADRVSVAVIFAISFLIGLILIRQLFIVFSDTVAALFLTIAISSSFNFLLCRAVLRRSRQ